MNKSLIMVAAVALGAVSLAGAASAKPELKDVAAVREGIIATGMAYEVTQKCSSISPRYFRAIGYLNTLKDHARGLGYTNTEIDAYIDNKAEENRLKAIAEGRLFELGAVAGDAASYCAVGRAEMAKNSIIGRLIR